MGSRLRGRLRATYGQAGPWGLRGDNMGEEMPWRGPLPFMEVAGWRGFHPRRPLGGRLQDFSCPPILLAWGTCQGCSAGQAPPRLASAPSSPNKTYKEGQALHFHTQPPEYRSTDPRAHTAVPTFPVKDHHAAPPPPHAAPCRPRGVCPK